jgi:hypothetical protein
MRVDSGDQYLLGGEFYYRQLNDLALNICVLREITDIAWREYIDTAMQIVTKLERAPSVSLCVFEHAPPNAKQRRAAARLFAEQNMPSMKRVAVFTESVVIKGAMTAFNWIMPTTALRAFRAEEHEVALGWVREVADFDLDVAGRAWREARYHLRIGPLRTSVPP